MVTVGEYAAGIDQHQGRGQGCVPVFRMATPLGVRLCQNVNKSIFPRSIVVSRLSARLELAKVVAHQMHAVVEVGMDKLLLALSEQVIKARDLESLTRPLLEMLASVTGLESTYLTEIDLGQSSQHVLFARNAAGLQIPRG